jgi:hypothetical protein
LWQTGFPEVISREVLLTTADLNGQQSHGLTPGPGVPAELLHVLILLAAVGTVKGCRQFGPRSLSVSELLLLYFTLN